MTYSYPEKPKNSLPQVSGSLLIKGLLLGTAGCLSLVLLPIAVVVLLGYTSFNAIVSGIQGMFTQQPVSAQISSTQTIVQSILPLGQVVSVSVQLAKADIQVGIEQGALNACGFGANHVAQGAVEAGIDLTQFSETDVTYDEANDTYLLTLPSPQLTSCRIDYIRQYDRTTTTCPVDWDEARLLANFVALNDFREDSLEGGVLDRAKRETTLIMGGFIEALTGSNVEIAYRDSANAVFPVSCTPPMPTGWVYNSETNVWTKP